MTPYKLQQKGASVDELNRVTTESSDFCVMESSPHDITQNLTLKKAYNYMGREKGTRRTPLSIYATKLCFECDKTSNLQ